MSTTNTKKFLGALTLLLAFGALSGVSAQGGLSFSIGKRGKHGHVGIGIAARGCHSHHHGCWQVTPGHYEVVCERVFVPGRCEKIWIAPVYRTEYTHCGNAVQVLVTPGHFKSISHPGHYETIEKKIWVPGRRVLVCGH